MNASTFIRGFTARLTVHGEISFHFYFLLNFILLGGGRLQEQIRRDREVSGIESHDVKVTKNKSKLKFEKNGRNVLVNTLPPALGHTKMCHSGLYREGNRNKRLFL